MPRITDYEKWKRDGELEDKLLLIKGWARDGLTDKQIGENLGLSHNAFCEYKKKYNEFYEALKINKEMADMEVENALYKRAIGYSYDEVTYERVFNKETNQYETKETKRVTKEVQPDTTAQIFWLKNRQKEKWRDKVEVSNVGNEVNNQIINIANLINNPKPNRGEDDVQ